MTAPPRKLPRLQRVLDRLQEAWGLPAPPPARTAFAQVLWENVGYLATDERRAEAFAALRKATRLLPEAVLGASVGDLVAICKLGGIHPELRARRLQDSARILLEEHAGDERRLLSQPLPQALRALRRFPAIGRPGAEKILLFTDTAPLLVLESNGLRALLRLGYGQEAKGYDQSYRSAQAAAEPEIAADCGARQRAFLLLRELGRRTCKRSEPMCGECPARALCPSRTEGARA
jgi:endonuclease III